jgi:GNAT superfamily N-acetyltransferase
VGDTPAEIRRASLGDAAEMTRLSAQLGYPMAPEEMTRRLGILLPNERHYIAVAASGARLLGWMHVEHRFSLEGGERAELMGLVVDSSARRGGVGRELVGAAEKWALARGLAALTVRSNAAREHSHPFYEALGYAREKTQHVYRKALM